MQLRSLHLSGTQISMQGLAVFTNLTSLRHLTLPNRMEPSPSLFITHLQSLRLQPFLDESGFPLISLHHFPNLTQLEMGFSNNPCLSLLTKLVTLNTMAVYPDLMLLTNLTELNYIWNLADVHLHTLPRLTRINNWYQ